ncbi:THAP domain-containing protein 1 [Plakobranchus ocellatus]|uniref:THAP domain-containing protein 1 n=1 Tax=Plakobranchus ocellatus TaxID=259542 RepID=A0AAV4DZX4_9GAST|nr:THAP domain-containing protein 1 [Plakobranchus ocellatus]
MGRKCSVYGCTSGYSSEDPAKKVSIFKFPDDPEECRQWVTCLPNKLQNVTKYMGICALHWPANTPLMRKNRGRYPCPTMPPSIFPNVPPSCVLSHVACTPRPTKKTLTSARNIDVYEMEAFKEQDLLKSYSYHLLCCQE